MKKLTVADALLLVVLVALWLGSGYGWVLNIQTAARMDSILSAMGVLRVVGVVVPPLGAVLGFV